MRLAMSLVLAVGAATAEAVRKATRPKVMLVKRMSMTEKKVAERDKRWMVGWWNRVVTVGCGIALAIYHAADVSIHGKV